MVSKIAVNASEQIEEIKRRLGRALDDGPQVEPQIVTFAMLEAVANTGARGVVAQRPENPDHAHAAMLSAMLDAIRGMYMTARSAAEASVAAGLTPNDCPTCRRPWSQHAADLICGTETQP
jgi:hypothetical protein